MLSYVEFYRPSYFLLENVIGLLQYPLMGRMVGRAFVAGIKMGVVKFIVRSLTCLGFVSLLHISYMIWDHNSGFDYIDIKSASKSCRLGNTVLLKAGSEYCSGERSADYLYPSFPCRHTHSHKSLSITPLQRARSCLRHRVQPTLRICISALRCTPSRSTTRLGTL